MTKKGVAKYWFSKKEGDNLPSEIPQGFEIYENPNGQVFLRKISPLIFKTDEIESVKNAIPKDVNYKIDIKKNLLTIHVSEGDIYYQPLMRFILLDENNRIFEAQRYCFCGSVDDWIELSISEDLKSLAKKCCYHIGKDSFFDLPYMVE